MAAIQREIDSVDNSQDADTVTSSADGGMVRVRLREDNVFVAVEIAPGAVERASNAELERNVLAAVNDATMRLEQRRRERIGGAIQTMLDDCMSRIVHDRAEGKG